MSDVVFASITECPEVHEEVARWLWGFWGNPRNLEFYRSMVRHARPDEIPATYIAFVDGVPAGTVSLLRADLFSRQDLFPWMADLYVCPEFRGRRIGPALQDLAIRKAKEMGYGELYLYTPLAGYYERQGWEHLGDEMDRDGEIVRIYKKKTG